MELMNKSTTTQLKMAPSSKQITNGRTKFTCVQCKCDMRVEKPFEIKQLSSERKVITEELEDLQKDMAELNQVMRTIKRCTVKEEINLISAKLDSLNDLIVVNADNAIPWSDVVAGRRRATHRLQKKPDHTLVNNNRCDLLSPNERYGSETGTSRAIQQLKSKGDCNKKSSDKKQNKIIILGDSHTRGCAQEVQHNLGRDFEVQGIVKPGANTEVVVNTSPNITRKHKKGRCSGVGRHT